MNNDLLKKLEQRVDRRTFLRGSGLAAAAVVGVAAFPLVSAAQDQSTGKTPEAKKDEKPPEEKKEDKKEAAPQPKDK